jgi:hypothetical protein
LTRPRKHRIKTPTVRIDLPGLFAFSLALDRDTEMKPRSTNALALVGCRS